MFYVKIFKENEGSSMIELTDDYFLNRGYQKYDRTQFQKSDMHMYSFQKRFDDENGKKIFYRCT